MPVTWLAQYETTRRKILFTGELWTCCKNPVSSSPTGMFVELHTLKKSVVENPPKTTKNDVTASSALYKKVT